MGQCGNQPCMDVRTNKRSEQWKNNVREVKVITCKWLCLPDNHLSYISARGTWKKINQLTEVGIIFFFSMEVNYNTKMLI